MNEWYKLKLGNLNLHLILLLMKNFENFGDIFNRHTLKGLSFSDEVINLIFSTKDLPLEEEKLKYEKHKIKIIAYNDDNYPLLLKEINSPPAFLYIKGNGSFSDKSFSVVGTRRISSYGKLACDKLVGGLSKSGVTIVSGLALGIDSYAHEIALKNNCQVIGVLGNSLDIVYPPSNASLYKKVAENGLLVSEYPLGTHPMPFTFPQRNRIIVGLTKGLLVVESFKKGGSLISAKLAVEEGRDVFACPGFINYPSFEGCNELIKNSEAKLVDNANDILTEYHWSEKNINKKVIVEVPFIDNPENNILRELLLPKSLDELVIKTKLHPKTLLINLSEMELRGLIKSISGGKFVKID